MHSSELFFFVSSINISTFVCAENYFSHLYDTWFYCKDTQVLFI